MTRILIPSDFTVDSLYFVSQSIEAPTAEEVDAILADGTKSSRSVSELVGVDVKDQLNELQSHALLKAYERISQRFKNRKLTIYAGIKRTHNVSYLPHDIKWTHIDEIKIMDYYNYQNKTRNFFDVGEALRKAKAQVLHPVPAM